MGKQFEAMSTTALRGGPAIVRPGGLRYSTWINTDRRKAVTLHVSANGGYEEGTGRRDFALHPGLTVRPSASINLSLSPGYSRSHNTWQYVAQRDAAGARRYLFGDLQQRTVSLTTRLNYTISPTLSFELYAQPFVSAGDYDGFMHVADPRAASFDDRFEPLGDRAAYDADAGAYQVDADADGTADYSFGNPDFNIRQLRSNAVLRYEYRPGSTLFVVWGQGRTGFTNDGSFGMRRDFADLLEEPSTNVLLIKLNYWLNF